MKKISASSFDKQTCYSSQPYKGTSKMSYRILDLIPVVIFIPGKTGN